MKAKRATARTQMSVKECADAFQMAVAKARGIRSQIGGLIAKTAGNANSGFFTPRDDSPFSSVDTDKPAFIVGCNIPKMFNSSQGAALTIHMYVWDRGSHRELEFSSPHSLLGGGSSAKLIRKILDSFRQADPQLQ